ncbi:mediator of RNA polymerase II transcription subunit 11-like [Clytia hemisphaerica]|uniref:mediator of RNA polymerase II transcription subunit 11-like n=1 Tax=Clytia hemisphaerica TaxID=252671 RepID=UPI0034D6BA6E
MSLSRDRLKQLEEVEKDVVVVIESASQSLLELSKQQPSEEYVIARTTEFLKGLEGVERKLNEHISYLSQVSTNQQHEGSIYSEEKRFQLVCESTDIVLKRIKALEKRVYPKKET